jgi:glutamyl-Q tRNA(Asp) synthetase
MRGEWLVRIEDIDPPREMPGAAASILRSLESLDLHWDRSVLYQSTRFDAYASAAENLLAAGLAFECSCSRNDVRALVAGDDEGPARYPGTCRTRRRHERATALRMRVDSPGEHFVDALQADRAARAGEHLGDYVIRRRDGLPAYHLAVVVDDAFQGVTTIVRGRDLLESTAAQRHLQRALGLPSPAYFHVPVLVGPDGQKLSKQSGAQPIEGQDRGQLASDALSRLGAEPPTTLRRAPPSELWEWALEHWRIEMLQGIEIVTES